MDTSQGFYTWYPLQSCVRAALRGAERLVCSLLVEDG